MCVSAAAELATVARVPLARVARESIVASGTLVDRADAPPPTDATPVHRHKWTLVLRWVPGAVLLAALVWLVATHLDEERQLARVVETAQPLWLVAAMLLQLGTYVTAGVAWRLPLVEGKQVISLGVLARLVLLKLAMDQAVPTGGISGALLMIRRLRERGVSAPVVASTFVIESVGFYMAYASAVVAALAVLWMRHDLPAVIAVAATVFAAGASLLPLGMLWYVRRRGALVPGWMTRFRSVREVMSEMADVSAPLLARRRLFVGAGLASFATILLDAATLTVALLAVGGPFAPMVAFAAVVMGSVAATIGIVPGGLGTFEAATVGVLTVLGVPSAHALTATLLLRALTFWLPMLVGLLLYRHEMRRSPKRGRGAAAP